MKLAVKKYLCFLVAFVFSLSMIIQEGTIFAAPTPSESEVYFKDFSEFEPGYDIVSNPIEGISLTSTTNTNFTIINDPLDSKNKCFEAYSLKATTTPNIKFQPSSMSGENVVVGMRLMKKTPRGKVEIRVYSSTFQRLVQFNEGSSLGTTGSMQYRTAAGETVFGDYNTNQWYDFVFVLNTTAKTYKLYLDGILVANNESYAKSGLGSAVSYFYVINTSGSNDYSWLYMDDVRMYSTIDAPQLRTTLPETGSINVSAEDSIVLQYNNSLANLSSQNVILKNNTTGLPVSYTGYIEGVKYKLKPTVPLDINTSYTVSVAEGGTDIFGQTLEPADVLTFTTGNQSLFITERGFTGTEGVNGDIITVLKNNGNVYYNISFANAIADQWGSEVILAVYDDESRLWKMKSVPVSLSKQYQDVSIGALLPSNATGYKAKAFLWDSLITAEPLQEPAVIPSP